MLVSSRRIESEYPVRKVFVEDTDVVLSEQYIAS